MNDQTKENNIDEKIEEIMDKNNQSCEHTYFGLQTHDAENKFKQDIKSLVEEEVRKERDRIVNDAKEEIEEFEEIAAQPDNDVYIEGWKQCVKFLENKQQTN